MTQHQHQQQAAPTTNATNTTNVQQEMTGPLKERSFRPAIVGYGTSWLAAAVDALARLGDELQLSDIQQHYRKQCAAGKELFMREWQRKSVGTVAHRSGR